MKGSITIGGLLTLLALLPGCALSNSGVKLANATNQWSTLGVAPAIDQANGHGIFRDDSERPARYVWVPFRAPLAVLHGLCTGISVYASYVPFTPNWVVSVITGTGEPHFQLLLRTSAPFATAQSMALAVHESAPISVPLSFS